MKILIILFLISISSYGQNGILFIDQKTIPADKQLHALAGTTIGFASYHIYYKKEKDNRLGSVILGTLTAIAVGTIKELSDSRKRGTGFSLPDLIYTGAGGVVGSFSMDFLSNNKRKKEKRLAELIQIANNTNRDFK